MIEVLKAKLDIKIQERAKMYSEYQRLMNNKQQIEIQVKQMEIDFATLSGSITELTSIVQEFSKPGAQTVVSRGPSVAPKVKEDQPEKNNMRIVKDTPAEQEPAVVAAKQAGMIVDTAQTLIRTAPSADDFRKSLENEAIELPVDGQVPVESPVAMRDPRNRVVISGPKE